MVRADEADTDAGAAAAAGPVASRRCAGGTSRTSASCLRRWRLRVPRAVSAPGVLPPGPRTPGGRTRSRACRRARASLRRSVAPRRPGTARCSSGCLRRPRTGRTGWRSRGAWNDAATTRVPRGGARLAGAPRSGCRVPVAFLVLQARKMAAAADRHRQRLGGSTSRFHRRLAAGLAAELVGRRDLAVAGVVGAFVSHGRAANNNDAAAWPCRLFSTTARARRSSRARWRRTRRRRSAGTPVAPAARTAAAAVPSATSSGSGCGNAAARAR